MKKEPWWPDPCYISEKKIDFLQFCFSKLRVYFAACTVEGSMRMLNKWKYNQTILLVFRMGGDIHRRILHIPYKQTVELTLFPLCLHFSMAESQSQRLNIYRKDDSFPVIRPLTVLYCVYMKTGRSKHKLIKNGVFVRPCELDFRNFHKICASVSSLLKIL